MSCYHPPAGGLEGLLGGGLLTFKAGGLAGASCWPSAESRAGLPGAGGFSLSLSFPLSSLLPFFPSSSLCPPPFVG